MPQTAIRILAWSSIVALFVVTDTMYSLRPHTIFTPPIDRFLALVCVGAVFAAAYPKNLPLVVGVLLTAVVGFELLQRLLPGRHGFGSDMFVKATGACVGVFVSYVMHRLVELVARSASTK
jgi:hypothetical protein